MKKIYVLSCFFVMSSMSLLSQVTQGDIKLVQDYFGVAKTALVKDYMQFTPQQDSAFWPIYKNYEEERLEMGKQRIALIDEYMASVSNITEAKATELVDKTNVLEISFKKLQKKYFTQLSKKIGPVKAAQFYQLESYLNNVINLSIQESIPFVGELEQKHDKMPKK